MISTTYPKIPSAEITPKQVYLSRRDFITAAGVIAGSMALAACVAPDTTGGSPIHPSWPGRSLHEGR